MEIKELLEKLHDAMERKSESPNIAVLSIMIEHIKFDLSRKMDKTPYLDMINFCRLREKNIYSAYFKRIEDRSKVDDIIKELEEENRGLLKALRGALEDL